MMVAFPVELPSVLNRREHWAVRARRAKAHRVEAFLQLRCASPSHPLPCAVTLVRVAPRPLDGDNLQAALKAVRDGVADWLKVDDRDARIEWAYGQRKGRPGERAVEIHVEAAA